MADTTAGTMTVRIRDHERERASWGSGPFSPAIRTVTISTRCAVCGGPRGEPRNLNQYEDGVHYATDVWDNPCGHVDYYHLVAQEAARAAGPVPEDGSARQPEPE